ncbi:MAG: hypothetical protein ACLRSW_07775 [Christensenellaceae bacterium]
MLVTRARNGIRTSRHLIRHSMGSRWCAAISRTHDEIDRLIVCGSPSKNPFGPRAAMAKSGLVKYARSIPWHNFRRHGDKKFPAKKGAWLTRKIGCRSV